MNYKYNCEYRNLIIHSLCEILEKQIIFNFYKMESQSYQFLENIIRVSQWNFRNEQIDPSQKKIKLSN